MSNFQEKLNAAAQQQLLQAELRQQRMAGSENQLAQDMYNALLPVVQAHLQAKQSYSLQAKSGLFLVQSASEATHRLVEQGIKHVLEAATRVGTE